MFCKKCGKEIRESNTFCTNCGQTINEEVKSEKTTNKKIKYIVLGVLLLIVIIIGVLLIYNNKGIVKIGSNIENNINTNTDKDNIQETKKTTLYDIETVQAYENNPTTLVEAIGLAAVMEKCTVEDKVLIDTYGIDASCYIMSDDVIGVYIHFRRPEYINQGYEMYGVEPKLTGYYIESRYGVVKVNDVDALLKDDRGTIKQLMDNNVVEASMGEYYHNETFLPAGLDEYSSKSTFDAKYELVIKKTEKIKTAIYNMAISKGWIEGENIDIDKDLANMENFLEAICIKYPTAKNEIQTDGANYWIVTKDSKKIYFTDFTSFEIALKKRELGTYDNEDNVYDEDDKEIEIKLYDVKSAKTSKITLDNASRTGAIYNFSNDEFNEAVKKTCKNNNVGYTEKENGFIINIDGNTTFIIALLVENNKKIGMSTFSSESVLEDKIFKEVMLELFEEDYVEQIVKTKEEISNCEYRYIESTFMMSMPKVELEQAISMFSIISVGEKSYEQVILEMFDITKDNNVENKLGTVFRDTNSPSYIKFTSETEFEMALGEENSVAWKKRGTYTRNGNILTLDVTYDSELEPSEYNGITEPFSPYQIKIRIKDTETLMFTESVDKTYIFRSTVNSEENTQNTNNFIEQIYNKYPAEKDNICSNDYDEYWLLDKEGNKVYFYDLESFENALEKCN